MLCFLSVPVHSFACAIEILEGHLVPVDCFAWAIAILEGHLVFGYFGE